MRDAPEIVVSKIEEAPVPIAGFCGHCGSIFEWVAKTESGKTLYYWCGTCDVPLGRRSK